MKEKVAPLRLASQLLLWLGLLYVCGGCSSASQGVRYIPAEEDGVVGYLYAWSEEDESQVARLLDEAARDIEAGAIERYDRTERGWQSNAHTTSYYAGIQVTAVVTETHAPTEQVRHAELRVLYKNEPPGRAAPSAWELRAEKVAEACSSMEFTEECVAESGRAPHSQELSTGLSHPWGIPDRNDLAALERYCAQSHPGACRILGFYYKNAEHGLPRDIPKSQEYLKRACELGEPFACRGYAHKLQLLASESESELQARKEGLRAHADELEAQYCEWGQVGDCSHEVEHIARRCEAGQLEWCLLLHGMSYHSAMERGDQQAANESVAVFDGLCDQRSARACEMLAQTKEDEGAQWALRARACQLGSGSSCARLRD